MRKRVWIHLILFVMFIQLGVYSQPKKEEKVDLSLLIQEAVRKNLQIQAAKKKWEAALEKIPRAKSLPDPTFGYSYFGQSIETKIGPQRNKISLSQRFPFFGKLGIQGKIAQHESSIAMAQYDMVKADILFRIKIAFYSLLELDRTLKISQEEEDVFKRLARIAEKKYETGTASQQDVLKAQLEIIRVKGKILVLRQRRKAVVSELNTLLNRPPNIKMGETEEFDFPEITADLKKLYAWAKEMRPELNEARSLIAKRREGLNLAKKSYYPDFSFMVDYIDIGGGKTAQPEDGRNSWMAAVSINLPVWRKKLHARKAEAFLKLKASEDIYRNTENETLSRINELYFEVKTAREQVNLFQKSLLPLAEQAFKASEVGYMSGKVDFLNLLDSERMILSIKTGYFKALSGLGKSLARLERFVGKELIGPETKNLDSDRLDDRSDEKE
jgi:outer membrane protein TolC